MTRKSKTIAAPRIGRKDLQDPDRDVGSPRNGSGQRDAERRDRDAGAGRREGRSRPADSDSPRPADDASAPK
jgi:hypothetical protein